MTFPFLTRETGNGKEEVCQGKVNEKEAEERRSSQITGHRVGSAVHTNVGCRGSRTVAEKEEEEKEEKETFGSTSRSFSRHARINRPIACGKDDNEGEAGKEYHGCGPTGGKRRKREWEDTSNVGTVEGVSRATAPEPVGRREIFFGFFFFFVVVVDGGAWFVLSKDGSEGEPRVGTTQAVA